MNRMRRTTITVPAEALATLKAERGGWRSLSIVVAEAVGEKAATIRARRRPRLAIGRSSDDRSAAEVTGEPVARAPK